MTRIAVDDGVSYSVTDTGLGTPLLLIHGFTGSAASWAPLLPQLARDHRVLTVELLGHGESDAPDAGRHAVERQAVDLILILDRVGAAPADVLGYSLGARVALRLAIESPSSVRRLVLESPSAGVADPAARAARQDADDRWIEQLEREDMDGFVRDWAAQPIFASQAHLAPERRANRPHGLATSLRGAGQGVMTPLHERLRAIAAPTLVVSGRLDPTGSLRAAEVARGIPGAIHEIIDDAGHTPHLETPARFLQLVTITLATPVARPIPTSAP